MLDIIFLDDDITRVDDFQNSTGLTVRHVKTFQEFVDEFQKKMPDLVMLDHDLGNDKEFGTGSDTAKWLSNKDNFCAGFEGLRVIIHSANSIGVANMMSHFKYSDHLEVNVVWFAWAKASYTDGVLNFRH